MMIFGWTNLYDSTGFLISPQIFIYFVCVTVAAVNAQWFGQMTSEIMADMHLIEQACGLGQDIGLSSNREAYAKLCETDHKYKKLSGRLWLYHLLSSLCNLCCIICNGYSLYYLAENLTTLWWPSYNIVEFYAHNAIQNLRLVSVWLRQRRPALRYWITSWQIWSFL